MVRNNDEIIEITRFGEVIYHYLKVVGHYSMIKFLSDIRYFINIKKSTKLPTKNKKPVIIEITGFFVGDVWIEHLSTYLEEIIIG